MNNNPKGTGFYPVAFVKWFQLIWFHPIFISLSQIIEHHQLLIVTLLKQVSLNTKIYEMQASVRLFLLDALRFFVFSFKIMRSWYGALAICTVLDFSYVIY